MSLNHSITVVTGGAGLIGSAFVEAILENDGLCVIGDLDQDKADSLQKRLSDKYGPGKAISVPLDITQESSIQELIAYSEKIFGKKIDVLVNNAYPKTADFGKDFFDVEYSTFCSNLNLHLGGYFLTSQIFAKYFGQKGGGTIVNMASIYGCVAPKFEIYNSTKMTNGPEYAMIKSGIIHLTKFMAKRFQGMNIRVNCISPGGIFDNQPETFLKAYAGNCNKKGMLNPNDLTGALIFLLSNSSEFMTGQNLIVDDGFTL